MNTNKKKKESFYSVFKTNKKADMNNKYLKKTKTTIKICLEKKDGVREKYQLLIIVSQ